MKIDLDKARIKIAKLCSIKEMCRYDVLEKLSKWEIKKSDAEKITDWLEDEKFIDDSRYSQFFVRDKYRFNKWGRIKIAYQLRHKKIKEEDISKAMLEIDNNEYENILFSLLLSKLRSINNDKYTKAKLYKYAQGRGFESNLIFKHIDILLKGL